MIEAQKNIDDLQNLKEDSSLVVKKTEEMRIPAEMLKGDLKDKMKKNILEHKKLMEEATMKREEKI